MRLAISHKNFVNRPVNEAIPYKLWCENRVTCPIFAPFTFACSSINLEDSELGKLHKKFLRTGHIEGHA